jgi:hypothetical protein
LPDGIFKIQKSKFGYFYGLAMEEVGICILWPFCRFYEHYGHNFWTLGVFVGYLAYFPPFWLELPRKIWQPWMRGECVLYTECRRWLSENPCFGVVDFVQGCMSKTAPRHSSDVKQQANRTRFQELEPILRF